MSPEAVQQLKVGDRVVFSPTGNAGEVTCVDLTDDDKIVIRWTRAHSEDVICETSPLWNMISAVPSCG